MPAIVLTGACVAVCMFVVDSIFLAANSTRIHANQEAGRNPWFILPQPPRSPAFGMFAPSGRRHSRLLHLQSPTATPEPAAPNAVTAWSGSSQCCPRPATDEHRGLADCRGRGWNECA